jgi:signal transduction histidine kinase
MLKSRFSLALQLVLGYGLLGTASIVVVSAVLYIGTVGVLDDEIDRKISTVSERLMRPGRFASDAALAQEVTRQLSDGVDSDRELFLVLGPDGRSMAGNVAPGFTAGTPAGAAVSRTVLRGGRPTPARLYLRRRASGATLVVGRDLSEQESIRALVWRALGTGAALSLLLTVVGSLLFRRQIERRIGDIRRTAKSIEAGDLSLRIPVTGNDEFGLLNRDINHMLDRIEHLMDGVRHVSNAIAHDLRTPLSRIRGKLDDALRHDWSVAALSGAAQGAIEEIDGLIRLFERLLQIAEAESGMRAQLFEHVDLNQIGLDMVDLYDPIAEDRQVRLRSRPGPAIFVNGDRNLLASALASLIDNAIKYAGAGASVEIRTGVEAGAVWIAVCDDGPGIPALERGNVTQRFYRLDKSRNLPGNGLGLSIVAATARLHGGTLSLEDHAPGLRARLVLPRFEAPA